MKQITFVVFALIFFSISSLLQAAIVEIGSKGNLQTGTGETWTSTGVSISDEALQYDAWKVAFREPGTLVPVKTSVHSIKTGLFKTEDQTIVDLGLVYDKEKKIIWATRTQNVVETKTKFNPFLIFAVLAILMMIIGKSAVYMDNNKKNLAIIVFSATWIFTAFALVFSIVGPASVAVLTALVTIIIAGHFDTLGRKFKIASNIFSACMIGGIVLFCL